VAEDVGLLQDSSTAVVAGMLAMWAKVQVIIPVLDLVELVGKLVVVGDGLLAVLAAVLVPAVVGQPAQVMKLWAIRAV
jgi:hypothetical protein